MLCLVCFRTSIITQNFLEDWNSQWICREMPFRNYYIVVDWCGTIEQLSQVVHHTIGLLYKTSCLCIGESP